MKIKNIITTGLLSAALAVSAKAATFTYNFTTSGANVASASPSSATAGAPAVTVTAWRTTNGSSFVQGLVTQNGSAGMGASTHSNDSHTIDNGTYFDFLLFSWSVAVDVNSFSIGYIDNDSDYRWAVGNTFNSALYTGGTNVNNGSYGANAINAGNTLGTYLLVGAAFTSSDQDDRFKISAVNISYTPPPPTQGVPDAGSTLILMGLGLLGLAGLKRKLV